MEDISSAVKNKLQIPGDGMKLAQEIRSRVGEKQPLIVFVTAYEKYVYGKIFFYKFSIFIS